MRRAEASRPQPELPDGEPDWTTPDQAVVVATVYQSTPRKGCGGAPEPLDWSVSSIRRDESSSYPDESTLLEFTVLEDTLPDFPVQALQARRHSATNTPWRDALSTPRRLLEDLNYASWPSAQGQSLRMGLILTLGTAGLASVATFIVYML